MVPCDGCKRDCQDDFLTQINPEGGYDLPRVLICDECMASDEWFDWRMRKWPNWPFLPIYYAPQAEGG